MGRFELVMGLGVLIILCVLSLGALIRLGRFSAETAFASVAGSVDYASYQKAFGMLLTVLILLELVHTVVYQFIRRHEATILLRAFLVISLLALTRKILVIDLTTLAPWSIAAFCLMVATLAGTFWLLGRHTRQLGGAPSRDH